MDVTFKLNTSIFFKSSQLKVEIRVNLRTNSGRYQYMGKPTGNNRNNHSHRYPTRSKDRRKNMHKIVGNVGKKNIVGNAARTLLYSATNTKNWFYKDTILDFFKKTRRSRITQQKITKIKPLPENFKSTIIQNGITFETESIKHLKRKLGAKNFKTVCVDYRLAKSNGMYQETLDAMKKGVPIIYQGVLHNYTNGTYGIPDLLVRSDWLNRVVKKNPVTRKESRTPAPALGKNYHYRVVDVNVQQCHLQQTGKIYAIAIVFQHTKGNYVFTMMLLLKCKDLTQERAIFSVNDGHTRKQ